MIKFAQPIHGKVLYKPLTYVQYTMYNVQFGEIGLKQSVLLQCIYDQKLEKHFLYVITLEEKVILR